MKKQNTGYQHSRGVIADNALAALVHDPLFRCRIETNKIKVRAVINVKRSITGATSPVLNGWQPSIEHWACAHPTINFCTSPHLDRKLVVIFYTRNHAGL